MYEFNPYDLQPFWESWYIEEKIGEGSFGYVYKISKEEFGAKYYSALKIIPVPGKNAEDKEIFHSGDKSHVTKEYTEAIIASIHQEIEAIRHEIQIMSELKGKTNIVSFEDNKIISMEDGIQHYVLIRMELLENLRNYQIEHPLDMEQVILMGKDLCKALILCHKKNIIHRDIKIDNVFVTRDGDFKLGDFGIAKQLIGAEENMSIKGTYDYMAPEMILRQPYDGKVDIYALGMVLYYYANNRKGPFLDPSVAIPKFGEKEQANNRRFQGERIPSPLLANDRLSQVILKAIEYHPKDRYQSAEEFLDALNNLDQENAIEKETFIVSREISLPYPETVVLSESVTIGTGIPHSLETPKSKSQNTRFIVVSVSMIIALSCGVWFFTQVLMTRLESINDKKVVDASVSTIVQREEPVIPEYDIDIEGMDVSDYSSIDKLENVTSLNASHNRLDSLLPLSEAIHLTYLNIQKNNIKSLDGIEVLIKLSFLNISGNKISDITLLKELVQLKELHLDGNLNLTDITPLKELNQLKVLTISNTNIIDISPILYLKNLKTLDISMLKISNEDIERIKEELPECEILH